MDEKDKKIGELRNLLMSAKHKIEELKSHLQIKQKQNSELKVSYEKKIKDLESESTQIIKQYEQRQLRYQKSLQQSQHLVAKYQAQALTNSQSNQQITQALTQIGNITMRIFTLNKVKDNSEAVQQLCNIEKCKEFTQQIEKIQKNEDLSPAVKAIMKITDLMSQALSKKREARLSYLKKETQLKKNYEEEQEKLKQSSRKISELQRQLKNWYLINYHSQNEWRGKIEEINKSKVKMSEQMANLEFVKQLMLKMFGGPKDASNMALQVLSKVLNMTSEEVKLCSKKIK